ncbi:MAG: N-acetyltransferase [Chitinophagaceae bacterium]
MNPDSIIVRLAGPEDEKYAGTITGEMEHSALLRGSGISKRSPQSIITKMREGKGVIALTRQGTWAGFSYMEVWGNGEFVSNSGLIVSPVFRNRGIAKAIKKLVFSLSRKKYPKAKVISITTGLPIMKLNALLGFMPVTFGELPREKTFWHGCKSCVNYSILKSKQYRNCLCTAMLYTPREKRSRQKGAA